MSLYRATGRWPRAAEVRWLRPEELLEEGCRRSRVVMVNEARAGILRCVRTRRIGIRLLPVAWRLGVRILAVEALGTPAGPPPPGGALEQPEMVDFLKTAREMGFEVVGYDADPGMAPVRLRTMTKKPAYANWRDGQQAANLAALLDRVGPENRLLVWCTNSRHRKIRVLAFQPMGWQFRARTGVDPFVIDQVVSVDFSRAESRAPILKRAQAELKSRGARSGFVAKAPSRTPIVEWARFELLARGGDAGFLAADGPPQLSPGSDACLLSLENELE